MISASAADAHRFGRVRRNGYDPAEVDAVVSRLIDSLRAYEERTAALEERLSEADASADAIRRTFVAAEKTRDEILDSARAHAQSVTDGARSEAEDIVSAARASAAEMTERAEQQAAALGERAEALELELASTRARILADAEADAERIILDAETTAAERTTTAADRAEAEAEAGFSAAIELERQAELGARVISTASDWTRREAIIESRRILADADERAAKIVADAERERESLVVRAAGVRNAVAALEASAARLAALTADSASVVDLTAIESLENVDVDPPDVDRTMVAAEAAVDEVVSGPQHGPETMLDANVDGPERVTEVAAIEPPPAGESDADLLADGRALTEPPLLLTVAEATEEMERDDGDEGAEAGVERERRRPGSTYYQRSTGIPLSERVKLARRSG